MESAHPAGRPLMATWLKWSLGPTALVFVALLISSCGSSQEPKGLNGMVRTPPIQVGSVTLPNENQETKASRQHLKGEDNGLMLIFFGYTFCPDVCPTTLADLKLALGGLELDERERVMVGMVTVDPKRDTGKVLNRYMEHFLEADSFASFRAKNQGQLARTEKRFGASHRLGKPRGDGYYDVDHSAQVFAVDSSGEVLVEWGFGTPYKYITEDLKSLLRDPGAAA